MTLLLTESFDAHPTNSSQNISNYLNTKWGQYLTHLGFSGLQGGVIAQVSSLSGGVTGRHGTAYNLYGGLSGETRAEIWFDPTTAADSKIIGFAMNITNNAGGGTQRLWMPSFIEQGPLGSASALPHVSISPISGFGGSTLTCRVWRGSSTTTESTQLGSDFVLPMNTWFYLEIKVKVHASTGEVTIKLDGTTIFTFTGNTKNASGAATSFINNIRFHNITANSPANLQGRIDDLYVCDLLGSAPFNDFLGDVTIEYLQPTANDTVAWTPSAGSNWDTVADAPATTVPITSDYVTASADDQQDLYVLADSAYSLPTTLFGVASYAYADKLDSGARKLALVQELSGSTVQSADQTLLWSGNGGPRYLRFPRELAPDGGAWTIAKLNSMKTGIKARP